jgi:hypothetical protein
LNIGRVCLWGIWVIAGLSNIINIEVRYFDEWFFNRVFASIKCTFTCAVGPGGYALVQQRETFCGVSVGESCVLRTAYNRPPSIVEAKIHVCLILNSRVVPSIVDPEGDEIHCLTSKCSRGYFCVLRFKVCGKPRAIMTTIRLGEDAKIT